MLEFKSEDSFVVHTNNSPSGIRLRVYSTTNPTTVSSRQGLNYLIGQTVLINGVERVVYGVDSPAIGYEFSAGRRIGLAVIENI